MREHKPARAQAHNPKLVVCTLVRLSAGFTLVELLIATVILSTGLLLVIEGMARSQQGMRVGENLVLASQVLEEQFSESEINVLQYHKLPGGSTSGKEIFPGKVFRWKKEEDAYSHPTIKDETKINQVTIQVSWDEGIRKNNLEIGSIIINREKNLK